LNLIGLGVRVIINIFGKLWNALVLLEVIFVGIFKFVSCC